MPEELTPKFESFVERKVREAQERGEFDNLPGTGKPLRLRHANESDWWLRQKIEDEGLSGIAPPPVLLRREKQDIQQTLAGVRDEATAREIIENLNLRIKELALITLPGYPKVAVPTLDIDDTLRAWRAARKSGC